MQFAVGLKLKSKAEHVIVDAEDALIAALKVKSKRPEALILYVRRQNRRGDARNPPRARELLSLFAYRRDRHTVLIGMRRLNRFAACQVAVLIFSHLHSAEDDSSPRQSGHVSDTQIMLKFGRQHGVFENPAPMRVTVSCCRKARPKRLPDRETCFAFSMQRARTSVLLKGLP